jgi:uncharacterized protein with von Willebrand factor type A (vWA) domain
MKMRIAAAAFGVICAIVPAIVVADDGPRKPAATVPTTQPAPLVVFMGVRDQATRVAFLCDSSGSMMTKFDGLRQELRKAVDGLLPVQSMSIIFFSEDAYLTLDKRSVTASPGNKKKASDFLAKTSPHGSSDPIPGLRAAFAANPQTVYLLTDGDFPNNQQVLDEIRKLNKDKKVKVHTIAFVDRGEEYEKLLKSIADENSGTYKFVGESDLGK